MPTPNEMFRPPSVSTVALASLGLAASAFAVNYISVRFFNYPFAYCGGRWVIRNFGLGEMWNLARLGLVGAVMLLVAMQRWRTMAIVLAGLTIMTVLPQWGDTLFRLGSDCSEQERSAREGHLESVPMLPPPAPLPPRKPTPPPDAPARP